MPYFKMSKGKITPQKGQEGSETDSMTGLLTGIWVKLEEFQWDGKDISNEKLYFTLKNDAGYNHISLFFDSTLSQRLIAFLSSADVTKELTLNVSLDDKGYTQAFISQDGTFLKGAFKGKDLPSWEKVQVSKTVTAWNKDAYQDALKQKVSLLSDKLPKFEQNNVQQDPSPKSAIGAASSSKFDTPVENPLPF